ncbi:HNH endonuclease [Pseudomonas sp. 13.2]|uniref:HNH endonuclease n=3 Tax=Pseudomonas TaxID=286 RepID=A0AAU7BEW7_9PSED
MIVAAKDGNVQNVNLDNLCLRTRAEHQLRNNHHYRGLPEEIVDILHLQNELKKEIRGRLGMKNKLSDLRDHLFAQLEAVREADDDNLAKEVQRAQSVSDISRVLIESAKVEIDYFRHIGGDNPASSFIESKPALPPAKRT